MPRKTILFANSSIFRHCHNTEKLLRRSHFCEPSLNSNFLLFEPRKDLAGNGMETNVNQYMQTNSSCDWIKAFDFISYLAYDWLLSKVVDSSLEQPWTMHYGLWVNRRNIPCPVYILRDPGFVGLLFF